MTLTLNKFLSAAALSNSIATTMNVEPGYKPRRYAFPLSSFGTSFLTTTREPSRLISMAAPIARSDLQHCAVKKSTAPNSVLEFVSLMERDTRHVRKYFSQSVLDGQRAQPPHGLSSLHVTGWLQRVLSMPRPPEWTLSTQNSRCRIRFVLLLHIPHSTFGPWPQKRLLNADAPSMDRSFSLTWRSDSQQHAGSGPERCL